jgi:hypothetical protein
VRHHATTSTVLTVAAIGAAVVLAPAAAAVAAPLTYPAVVDVGVTVNAPFPEYDIAVDCEAFTEQWAIDETPFYGNLYSIPGGSLTITFSCELDDYTATGYGEQPGGSVDVAVLDGVTTVTVVPGTSFRAFFFDSAANFRIDYFASAPLDDPAGSLLHSVTSAYSGETALFAVGNEGNVYDCTEGEGVRPYTAQQFTVLTEGEYTFRFTGFLPYEGGLSNGGAPGSVDAPPNPWGTANPFYDPALVLYSTFTPTDTEAGFIACDDDSEAVDDVVEDQFSGLGGAYDSRTRLIDEYFSELTITLTPGTYTLVTLPYDSPALQDVSASKGEVSEPAENVLAPAYLLDDLDETGGLSTEVEYWGQPGGLVLGTQLAATGASTTAAAGLGALAALLLVAGATALVVRSRATARD